MIHPDSELFDAGPAIGQGVRATAPIPRGTIVWALDRFDIVLSAAEFETLGATQRGIMEHYGYRDHLSRWILCWDAGRLINHSCLPAMRGVGPEIMIAMRDLAPGDELTCDYAECNIDPPLECRCGVAVCRGRVGGGDVSTYADVWDAEVRDALARAGGVPQPLQAVLLDPVRWREIVAGRAAAPSLREIAIRAPAGNRAR